MIVYKEDKIDIYVHINVTAAVSNVSTCNLADQKKRFRQGFLLLTLLKLWLACRGSLLIIPRKDARP